MKGKHKDPVAALGEIVTLFGVGLERCPSFKV